MIRHIVSHRQFPPRRIAARGAARRNFDSNFKQQIHVHILAAGDARGLRFVVPQIGGSRKCRMRAAPAVPCAKWVKKTHTSIQVQQRHSGIPCAMALRLMLSSPRRRIRLASVAAGLMAKSIRLDRSRHRQLGTSSGCRDHTVLPYASTSYVLRDVNRSRVCPALRPPSAPMPSRPPHPASRS